MKRFSKTLLICLLLIAVLAIVLTGCSHKVGNELLSNGNFETLDSNGRLDKWSFVYVDKNGEAVSTKSYNAIPTNPSSVEQNYYGSRYIEITTDDFDVAYLKTSVRLYAGQKYHLQASFKVSSSLKSQEGDDDAFGAYIGFKEDKNFKEINTFNATTNSDPSKNNWVTRDIYFKPSVTATYTFVAGIGREDVGGARGTIQFDNLSISAIKEEPVGTTVVDLTPGGKITSKEAGGVVYTVLLCLFSVALVVGSYYLIRLLQKRQSLKAATPLFDTDATVVPAEQVTDKKVKMNFKQFFEPKNLKKTFTSPIAIFIYTLLAAFLVRFILVLTVFGMDDTMTNYAKVALTIAQDGPSKLYKIQSISYPHGWLYLLGFFGVIGNALEFTESTLGMSMLIRIPNIIADLATCYIIYKMLANNYNDRYSAVIAGTYAILPAMFTGSVAWGMNMSIALMFLVAMINFMLDKKHLWVPVMYTLGLMFSNFMLIALPVVIGYEIFYCVKDKKAIMPIVLASVASFVVFYCLAIPFVTDYFAAGSKPNGGIMLFSKMLENIKGAGLITNSSFNFFAIFGLGNNASNGIMIILIALVMILFAIYGAYLFSKTRNRLDYVLLLAMSFLLWATFGIGSKVEFTLIGSVLLLIYAGLKMESRVYKAFGVLTATNFVNMAYILTKSGAINYIKPEGATLYQIYKLEPIYIIGSLITLFVVLYMLWIMYDIMANGFEKEIKPMADNLVVEFKENFENNKNRMIKLFKGKNNASKNK